MSFDKNDYFFIRNFDVDDVDYMVLVTKKYEVILAKIISPYEPFHKVWEPSDPTTLRIKWDNKFKGMLVYKKALKIVLEYLYEYRPPYFYYSTDGDDSRTKLYTFLSNVAEKHNYHCYYNNDYVFYFVRKNN